MEDSHMWMNRCVGQCQLLHAWFRKCHERPWRTKTFVISAYRFTISNVNRTTSSPSFTLLHGRRRCSLAKPESDRYKGWLDGLHHYCRFLLTIISQASASEPPHGASDPQVHQCCCALKCPACAWTCNQPAITLPEGLHLPLHTH